ncbi:ethanolamine utilization protein [Streptococcus cuniculi]|uniref:Ethanolamine utilization protein n=1 Tax=Streptococcus cuniculi TaxID=1432788 RepID=A0A4Y9JF39_9STRE|nr:ethanolamine utilization protein [Streptococcus cuniculi]MBF0777595.1 ethanolamine utilization protein [Streptococcus cuniculi]TFU98636.1 ethanolamine utilization protein [Streptococcus cuniculi]
MENLDKLVQLITDRLLENLQDEPNETSVYLIGKDRTDALLVENGYRLVKHGECADVVVVDCLALDAFLRIASLCPANEVESAILTSLLDGKPVYVSLETFNVEQYKHSARSRLYRELLEQKAKLEKYGVQFYRENQLLNLLDTCRTEKEEFSPQQIDKKALTPKAKTNLITEAKLRAMGLGEGDSFAIEKGMIVTALAKDYLKRHKIRIVK